MVLPQTLPIPTETAIASYSFTDIASGTGVEAFFGTAARTSGGITYNLTSNITFASDIKTSGSDEGSDIFNEDFDITFNFPRIISGIAIVNIPLALQGTVGSWSLSYTITIKKVSGQTVTTLVTGGTESLSGPSVNGVRESHMFAMALLIPLTHFKIDDKLRIQVSLSGTRGAGFTDWAVGHDPKGREDGTYFDTSGHPSTMIFNIPFRIDL